MSNKATLDSTETNQLLVHVLKIKPGKGSKNQKGPLISKQKISRLGDFRARADISSKSELAFLSTRLIITLFRLVV